MAWRSNVRDAAHRAYLGFTRGTLKKTSDKHLLQEVNIDLYDSERKEAVERFQQYGFTAVVQPEKDDKDQHPAEALIAFLGGNRGHAVVLAIDDRRYRLKGLKDGEVALYDDQGQQVHMTRDGIVVSAPMGKKIVTQIMSSGDRPTKGNTTDQGKNGQSAQASEEAYASLVLTKDGLVVTHPQNIVLKTKTFKVESQTTSIEGKRIETVGPTHLGLTAPGGSGPTVETIAGPAKQTDAEV